MEPLSVSRGWSDRRSGRPPLGWPAIALLALTITGCSAVKPENPAEVRYRRVTPEVAYYLVRDSPDILLLDLRATPPAGEPVPDLREAQWLPLAELVARVGELEPYRNRTFLVYCAGDRECGHRGMQILVGSGWIHAVLIDGSLDDWAEELEAPAAESEDPPPPPPTPPL